MRKRLILTAMLPLVIGGGAEAQDSPCQVLWHPIIQLTDSTYSSYQPKIALSGDDTVHVTWWEAIRLEYEAHRIPYLRSTTGGESWSEPVRDLATPQLIKPFQNNHIATDGNNVYLFSAREPESSTPPWSPQPMVISKSTNRGTSWVTWRTSGDSAAGLFSVNVLKDTMIVVYAPWKNGGVRLPRLMYSTNGGLTWTKSSDTLLNGWEKSAYTAGRLHLTKLRWWEDGFLGYRYFRSSTFGNSYEHSVDLSAPDADPAECDMRSDGEGRLVVSWRDFGYGCFTIVGCAIVFRETGNNGNTWYRREILTDIPDGYNPSLAVHKELTVASWTSEDQMWNPTAIVRVRKGLQAPWSELYAVGLGGFTSVAVSDKAVHVVWTDIVDNSPPEKWGVFYRRGEFIQGSPNQIGYRPGSWNLVSHPLRSSSPVNLPSLYRYDGNYVRTQTMEEGRGYWAKPETDTVNYEGSPLTSLDIPLKRGWNIVGSISCPVLVGTVITEPAGILTSPFFGYKEGRYEAADRIEPGRAYWVRAGEAGTLRLTSDLAEQDRARASAATAHRSITQASEGDALPPPPPDANIENRTSDIPQSFSLEQNYPNPFNPVTEIRFGIRDAGYVTLKVYDVLGREVARLVEGDREPGYYEVRWDARDLPGGVYYVRMRAGEFTETRAAVVMK